MTTGRTQRGSVSLRKLSTGATVFDAFLRNEQGKRVCRRGFGSRAEAVAWLEEATPEVRSRRFLRNQVDPIALADYARTWTEARLATGAIRASTADQYRSHLRRLERAGLGALKLDEVTASDVNRFLLSVKRVKGGDKPLGSKVKRATTVFLSGLFEAGMTETPKRCTENPLRAKAFHRPKLPRGNAARDLLTQAEASAVLDQCGHPWGLFFWLLAASGARIGEVGAARWSDVDLDLGVLTVSRTFYRGAYGPTKGGEPREVDLPGQVLGALAHYRTETFGTGPVDGARLLFPGRIPGQPLDQTHARRVWAEASRRAGVRYLKPHALRHMWASVALKQSGDVKWVQSQLGHASAKLTLDVYGHVLRERRRERVSAIEASLGLRDGGVMASAPESPAMASGPVDASARRIERPTTEDKA